MKENLFARNVPGMTEVLHDACVGIAGCGGLGSNVAVALTRAGIGRLILVDFDRVEQSNLNRQHYFISDIGVPKANALADHLRRINPDILLDMSCCRITPDNLNELFASADILVEAFDAAEQKIWLMEHWCSLYPDRPLVSGNGVAGYGKTTAMRVVQAGTLYFCGDLESDMSLGLCAPRVGLAANMQANVVVELLMDGGVI